jgi:hypothetical protein
MVLLGVQVVQVLLGKMEILEELLLIILSIKIPQIQIRVRVN